MTSYIFTEPTCKDNNVKCNYWASIGECSMNPGYMLINCKKSCKQCGNNIYVIIYNSRIKIMSICTFSDSLIF